MLSEKFNKALIFSSQVHAHQMRKASQIPYIAHLMSVAALVMEAGGSETEIIAALLHDAVEDQGGKAMLSKIERKFGSDVADIVLGCSDSVESPKNPWRERKETYLEHLINASESVILVSLADKLHNSRSILADLRTGKQVWDRFKGGKEGTLWYYRSLVDTFIRRSNLPMLLELERTVLAIERLAAAN